MVADLTSTLKRTQSQPIAVKGFLIATTLTLSMLLRRNMSCQGATFPCGDLCLLMRNLPTKNDVPLSFQRLGLVLLWASLALPCVLLGEPPEQCDPARVLGAGTCAKCHAAETEVWKATPHFRTFDTLHRTPRAKEIASKLAVSSIKRSELCASCHYTQQQSEGKLKTVAGISCESCHGAARDWLALHNDFGPSVASRAKESPPHRTQRIEQSTAAGMRNPANLYAIARSCLACHTVPNEKLVNVGGHVTGSADFNFVAWSQGKVKHTFLSHGGRNGPSSPDRLRVMYVLGVIADLEFSTRATGEATQKARYGLTAAQRSVAAALRLQAIQATLQHPQLAEVLTAFAEAELRTNNAELLNAIADRIRQAGLQLAEQLDGQQLTFLDAQLPPPSTYK